jgi:hypothetical protein
MLDWNIFLGFSFVVGHKYVFLILYFYPTALINDPAGENALLALIVVLDLDFDCGIGFAELDCIAE